LFDSVAIVSRIDKPEAIRLAKEISSYLENKGITVKLEADLANKLKAKERITLDFKTDLLVTIGGDGTVLRAFHLTNGSVPIFPIRMGTVGFLCDEDWDKAITALDKLLIGEYVTEVCFSLQSNLDTPLALNEFRVGCALPSHPVELEVYVDEFLIAKDKLDGMIVSTNTGASAYALSAGANIIDPRLKAIMIVPICPLSPNFKPYVIPSDSTVKIRLINENDLVTLVDGEYQKRLSGVKELKIFKSQRTVTILRTRWNFYERLKRRLNVSSTKWEATI
jgi:NAD+ kinase